MKKLFKSLVLLCLTSVCLLGLSGCVSSSPKSIMKEFLSHTQTLINENDLTMIDKLAGMYYWTSEEAKIQYIAESKDRFEKNNVSSIKEFQDIKFSLVNFDLISQRNLTKNDAVFYYDNEKITEVIEVNIKIEVKETTPAGSINRYYAADDDLIYSYLSSYGLINLKCDSVTTFYKIDSVWYMGIMPCKDSAA